MCIVQSYLTALKDETDSTDAVEETYPTDCSIVNKVVRSVLVLTSL